MQTATKSQQTVHASCVALGASAVLICGKSGSGKSALALQLMAIGAMLVADDRTLLMGGDCGLTATSPKSTAGQIEARGIGMIGADYQAKASVRLVVDLDHQETARLPETRNTTLLGCNIPLLYVAKGPHFPATIIQILKGGIIA